MPTTRELLERAVMGDEEAIDTIAARLDGAPVAAADPATVEYAEHIAEVSQQHPKIFNNPQRLAALTQIDQRLAHNFPELGWERRTALAINAERRGQSAVESDYDAQVASDIESMRVQRNPEFRAAQFSLQRQQRKTEVDESRIRRPPPGHYDDDGDYSDAIDQIASTRPRSFVHRQR